MLTTCLQKAMDLYKTECSKRMSFVKPIRENLYSHSEVEQEVEETWVVKEEVQSPVNFSVEKKEPTLVVHEVSSIAPVTKVKETALINSHETLHGGTLQSTELAIGVEENHEEKLSLIPDKTNKNVNLESATKSTDGEVELKVEVEVEVEVSNGGKCGIAESASDKVLVGASDASVLSHDCVDVCDTLNLVSNESDSVNFSRIHHAPQSTY